MHKCLISIHPTTVGFTENQKKNRREQSPVHSSRPPIIPSYQPEQRDHGGFMNPTSSDLERVSYSAMVDESNQTQTTPSPTESSSFMKLLPSNISMFSMILGVLVGLTVLILLIIAFGYRTRRQRAAYARRKALSDQATTDNTTFSDAEKMNQHQRQPTPMNQHVTNFSYHPGSDNGGGGGSGIASTYMPHAMFASENCWPTGLQPVPPGGNYFDEEVQQCAFPPLGRDSGSHGYAQLPISSSHHSGLIYSHQSSTTTMNRSNNQLLPYQTPHNCCPPENFSVGPRICSPAVNSTLSTESDRFSGNASSHPSSFQPIYQPNSGSCVSPHNIRHKSQLNQPLWMGYDECPALTLLDTPLPDNMIQDINGIGNDISNIHPNAMSFESLIEPPDSFKTGPPSIGMPLEAVPPRMAQLRRLEKSINGNGEWNWQEGEFSEH
ncbi:unnamed protein product [Rodentolepis nana]|uniref:Uncharacterized protein n=1 Tax=Rodentolepis nana TaxID=102285 RepID=A0A3P7WCQ2_RODNA|nr:unnamed protein product [Rodentolepis nana]